MWMEPGDTDAPFAFWTRSTSECRSDADGCSSSVVGLTAILLPQPEVPDRFFLSARAARGVLTRAEKNGVRFSETLTELLRSVADGGPNPPGRVQPVEG